MAAQVEQALNTVFDGGSVTLTGITAGALLTESVPVAAVIAQVLDRPETGLTGPWRVRETLRRAGVLDDLLNSLVSADPASRAAAARICGALRLTEAVQWIGDLLGDPDGTVRDTAIRSLGHLGGRRAVDVLIGAANRVPLYRLAPALADAASDIDVEALMRKPPSERAAVAIVMACGLRKDVLRVPPLLGIAHDRRWPKLVRLAACRGLAMIADPAATGGLRRLADTESDAAVKAAAERSHRRLVRAAGRSWR
jgi:HEAT repeat protein